MIRPFLARRPARDALIVARAILPEVDVDLEEAASEPCRDTLPEFVGDLLRVEARGRFLIDDDDDQRMPAPHDFLLEDHLIRARWRVPLEGERVDRDVLASEPRVLRARFVRVVLYDDAHLLCSCC